MRKHQICYRCYKFFCDKRGTTLPDIHNARTSAFRIPVGVKQQFWAILSHNMSREDNCMSLEWNQQRKVALVPDLCTETRATFNHQDMDWLLSLTFCCEFVGGIATSLSVCGRMASSCIRILLKDKASAQVQYEMAKCLHNKQIHGARRKKKHRYWPCFGRAVQFDTKLRALKLAVFWWCLGCWIFLVTNGGSLVTNAAASNKSEVSLIVVLTKYTWFCSHGSLAGPKRTRAFHLI